MQVENRHNLLKNKIAGAIIQILADVIPDIVKVIKKTKLIYQILNMNGMKQM